MCIATAVSVRKMATEYSTPRELSPEGISGPPVGFGSWRSWWFIRSSRFCRSPQSVAHKSGGGFFRSSCHFARFGELKSNRSVSCGAIPFAGPGRRYRNVFKGSENALP